MEGYIMLDCEKCGKKAKFIVEKHETGKSRYGADIIKALCRCSSCNTKHTHEFASEAVLEVTLLHDD